MIFKIIVTFEFIFTGRAQPKQNWKLQANKKE